MAVTESAFANVRDRVTELERKSSVKEVTDEGIEERLAKIESILSRLTWIILGGIVAAFGAFMINGGLAPAARAGAALIGGT